ncbi:hypothetical protein JW930_04770 [Candidatus Woesearchaeota archaeon]|nr:hypothetical protein [Candidatus Woesearchaeota archaeon]
MSKPLKIDGVTEDPIIDLVLDTIKRKKQAIIFVNTKRSAESVAERIALKLKTATQEVLSEQVLKALSSPTRQCKRLSYCVSRGVAFHHSGLASKQRSLVENSFRNGEIRIIAATPTLAMGIDLPAFRTIIRDLKRYGGSWGMSWIPVLEYHQQAGRAGRPKFDKYGESICLAKSESEKEEIVEKFLLGDPEPIYSKLAVEPILRTHVLSLIASGFVNTKKELLEFFEQTFYGFQYKDIDELDKILSKIIRLLEEWGFVESITIDNDFVAANQINEFKIMPTQIGIRVSQLYLDPYTADYIITSLKRAMQKQLIEFSFLSMITNTLELRPLFSARAKEIADIQEKLAEYDSNLIVLEPTIYDPAYDNYMSAIKTAIVFEEWMEEKGEDFLYEKYGVTPGELRVKLALADWLLYATEELASLSEQKEQIKYIRKTRYRLMHGVKEELLPLTKLRGIGRVRARRLFRNKIRDLGDIRKADIALLSQIVGKETALKIKEHVGEKIEKILDGRRKGQLNLRRYKKKIK